MILLLLSSLLCVGASTDSAQDNACYTADLNPTRCMPDFINIAFKAQVFSSNTCGDPVSEFCVQQEIGLPPQDNNCYTCDKDSEEDRHPPAYLTDNNEDDNPTWWQSQTLYDEDINNMTLHLPFNKSFDIEYIKIEFQSPRPESMVIEKSTDYGRNWEIYQYFSSSCYKTFNKRTDEPIYIWDETKPVCTNKYSEISPLLGGVVNFSPLFNRPSASDLYNTPILLSWMRATDIRIRLMRLNTFGDQYFSDDRNAVLKTYFYAIRDLSVGGRCTCHGHGGTCTKDACKCEHFTAGRNCERCLDIYNDLPWTMSTTNEPFQCKECNCNGLATRCVFDENEFIKSNNVSGGMCVGCRANTAGLRCEECARGYYPDPNLPVGHNDRCKECECNVFGSVGDGACAQDLDMNRGLSFGDCQCKPHVQGVSCDTCEDGYHSLQEGCPTCECDIVGTSGDYSLCSKVDGQCKCNTNVTGQRCNECLPSYWNYILGCESCNCDPAGALSDSCNQETGQCECREGMEGLDCAEAEEGSYKPDIDSVSFLPDIPEIDGDTTGTATTDFESLTSISNKLTHPDNETTITFKAPKDDSYTIYVQYSYAGSDDANVRFVIVADDNPEEFDKCMAEEVQTHQGTVPKDFLGVYAIRESCLDDDVVYKLHISLEDPVPGATPFVIRGIVLIPTPSAAVIDRVKDELKEIDEDPQLALEYCLEKIAALSPVLLERDYPECAKVADVIIADITNGSVSCDCDRVGANEPDTCEPTGGQCACKPNVNGLKCNFCKPGYHSLSDTGCDSCSCSQIGASSPRNCDTETGECTCKPGVIGNNCTECGEGMFGFSSGKGCTACECSVSGSSSLQCDQYGQCPCKAGIDGLRCDRCQDGFFDFSDEGCRECGCSSVGGSTLCDMVTGDCRCKDNVQGVDCLQCKDNAFSLQGSNPAGCQLCFCHLHTEECDGDISYTPDTIYSDFAVSDDGWTYRLLGSSKTDAVEHVVVFENIRIHNREKKPISYCLVAPDKFLGNQIKSFLTPLKFSYNLVGTQSDISEIIITGKPYTLSLVPRIKPGDKYWTTLHHAGSWQVSEGDSSLKTDKVTEDMFKTVLADIVSIEICTTIYDDEAVVLTTFSMGTAKAKDASGRQRTAYNIEMCSCPEGYSGSSCEDCTEGYKREEPSLGRLSACIACECNRYSDTCDSQTGACVECKDNTGGDMCERCEVGFYGDPAYGNPSSCKACACPSESGSRSFSNTCELKDDVMMCTNCTEGHIGDRCDECADGFYGEPTYDNPNQKCTECTCNGNIDLAETDNCDTQTGQCLKCMNHTAGRYCEECARGYHGDAITAKDCEKCMCDSEGSRNMYLCDNLSGQCDCKPNVEGISCDSCKPNHYDLESGEGCLACECDLIGSSDLQCGDDGSCTCNPGYFGIKCNECATNYYYHPDEGCVECGCDPEGSEGTQCDAAGQCPCKGAVHGRQCNECPTNMVDLAAGCVNCPDCYSLVTREVELLKEKLVELAEIMDSIDTPTIEASPDFRRRIDEVQAIVQDTFEKANETATMSENLNAARTNIENLISLLRDDVMETEEIMSNVDATVRSSEYKLSEARATIDSIAEQLDNSVKLLLEEGERALQTAEENMNNLSQENVEMQRKANQARQIAAEQETTSAETVKLAAEAQQLSASALSTAKKARDTLRATQEQLGKLTADIGELKEEYELAKNAATTSSTSAAETLRTAELLKASACSADDSLDLEELRAELATLADKAEVAVQNADDLQERAAEINSNADETIEQANELLLQGTESDSKMALLKSDAQEAFDQSEAAVQECSDMITEAQELLEFLKNYENVVATAKETAKNAIAELGDLEAELDSAEQKVEDAEERLGEGKNVMSPILVSIKESKMSLEASLSDARDTASKIAEMLKNSDEVKADAGSLKEDVAAASAELKRLREVAKNGTDALKEVLKDADDAKGMADSVGSDIGYGERRLISLEEELQKIDTVDAVKLAELIKQLTDSNDLITSTGIDDKIAEMRLVSVQQEDKIGEYRAEIERMRDEIFTLEKIESQIPDTSVCYNPNQ